MSSSNIFSSKKSPLSTLAVYLLIAVCVVGGYTAFTWGMGDLYGYNVRYATAQWQKRSELPSADEVSAVLSDVDSALGWESGNPEYLELKARVLYYRALITNMSDDGLADIAAAKALHLQAIQLRPRWPYSWANLVLMKSYLNEFDEEYQEALSNAVRFGPWEQSVHLTLSHAAALSWASLTKEQKRVYAGNIERGIIRNMGSIRSTIDAYQKRSPICAYLKRDATQKKFCSS